MPEKNIVTRSPEQTRELAGELAGELACKFSKKSSHQGALVLGLQGRLGSGKTTFVQGFARGLGVGEKITSPTYVLMKKYECRRPGSGPGEQLSHLYHIDCYRLEKAEELLQLGWKEIRSQNKNIVLIEWPERVKKLLPEDAVFIRFFLLSPDEPDKRKITIET